VAPKRRNLGGRALRKRAKAERYPAELTDAPDRSHGVISDGTQARTNTAIGESPPRPGKKSPEKVGHITGNTGKVDDGERVEDGSVIALKAGNAARAKGPY